MSQNFDLNSFAEEVVYDLRSVKGRETFVYDYGCGHVSDEQQSTIQAMMDEGSWDQEAFTSAVVRANRRFADDLLEGTIEASQLPEGERDIHKAMEVVRQTGNEDIIESAKEFFRGGLEAEIDNPNPHFNCARSFGTGGDEKRFIIFTKASWVGGSQNQARAVEKALEGNFAGSEHDYDGINRYATEKYPESKASKMAAKALRAEIKEYIGNTPEVVAQAKTGLSAAADQAAFKPTKLQA